MEDHTGKYDWVPAEYSNRYHSSGKDECYSLDSCYGGLGASNGGCYKWALSPDSEAESWFKNNIDYNNDGKQCYLMDCSEGCTWQVAEKYWEQTPGNFTKHQCFELDSCDGGLGRSSGGCYKWAYSADSERDSWFD